MKHFITLLLILTIKGVLCSQSLSVFNINTTSFPLIKAKMIVTDQNNNFVKITNPLDVELIENGVPGKLSFLSCPESKPPAAVSLAISIDVSGSMCARDDGKTQRVEFGKLTAQNLVNALANKYSEVALQKCDDKAVIITDFTNDKDLLTKEISKITARGNNDFVEHLLNEKAGILNVAKTGKYQRVALVFTDAFWPALKPDKLEECKKICSLYKIKFFAVIHSAENAQVNGIVTTLKALADFTGGLVFEGSVNEEKAEQITSFLESTVQNTEPCTIEWTSDICDPQKKIEFSVPKMGISTNIEFQVPSKAIGLLEIDQKEKFIFVADQIGNALIQDIVLKAYYRPIVIDSINIGLKNFEIIDYGGSLPPFPIDTGESRRIRIKFTAEDSFFVYSSVQFHYNKCRKLDLMLKGGLKTSYRVNNGLKIIQPNGGEKFAAGTLTKIKWAGTAPSEYVSLSYSPDSGATWQGISSQATEGELSWRIPKINSDKCLMKASQWYMNRDNSVIIDTSDRYMLSVKWSPNNRYFLSAGADSLLKIWDASTLKVIETITNPGNIGTIKTVCWSPDSKYIAVGGFNPRIAIVNISDISDIKVFNTKLNASTISIDWSNDGKYIAVSNADSKSIIYDALTFIEIFTLESISDLTAVIFSPDSKTLAIADYSRITLWDFLNGKVKKYLPHHFVYALEWSDLSNILILGNDMGEFYCYDFDKNIMYRADHYMPWSSRGQILTVDITSDGRMAVGGSAAGKIILLDLVNRDTICEFTGHHLAVTSVCFSKDEQSILSCGQDGTTRIWSVAPAFQQDISDSCWSISVPKAESRDIDMGKNLVGTSRDTLVNKFIYNSSDVPLKVDSIKISGSSAKEFMIISGMLPLTIPPFDSSHIEIKFSPATAGIKQANIIIKAAYDTLIQKLSAEGIIPEISLINDSYDFGKVMIDSAKIIRKIAIRSNTDNSIKVDSVMLSGPDTTQFYILSGGGSFELSPQKPEREMTVMFKPEKTGRTNGSIQFSFQGNSSPLSVSLYGEGVSGCDSSGFSYQEFLTFKEFNLVEGAYPWSNFIRLTKNEINKTGAVWYKNYMNVKNGFTAKFEMRMSGSSNTVTTDGSLPGADGFAFVLQNYHPFAVGLSGGGIGYEGILNGLAVEFDLFNNDSVQITDYKDPNGNHTAVQISSNGKLSSKHTKENTLGINTGIVSVKSDSSLIYHCKVVYNANVQNLSVYLDTLDEFGDPVISLDSFRIEKYLNLYSGNLAIVGITASTGSAFQRHDLLSWSMCTGTTAIINEIDDSEPLEKFVVSLTPNPVVTTAELRLDLRKSAYVKIRILDIFGKEISEIHNTDLTGGFYVYGIDAEKLASGLYYCIVDIDNQRIIKELIVNK